ncbi:hypothetical protein RZN25_08015 [Bacillaceae bacterium S4-13-56]
MNKLTYKFKKNDSLNRWIKLGTFETEKTFSNSTMEGEINNEWLVKGHAIHEFPGRKEFIEQRVSVDSIIKGDHDLYHGLKQRYKDKEKKWELQFPFESPVVEDEGFWDIPTHLEAWTFTELHSEENQLATFKLSTCGGVKIWVNDQIIEEFTPFTRNVLSSKVISIHLQKGINKVLVYYDDLAERDTKFSFQLEYLKGKELSISVPIDDQEPQSIYELEYLLYGAYFERDSYTFGEINFEFMNEVSIPFKLICKSKVERCQMEIREYEVCTGSTSILLGNIHDFQMGYNAIEMIIEFNEIKISRNFGVEIYPIELEHLNSSTIQDRKKNALEITANYGEHNIYKVLAGFHSLKFKDMDKNKLESYLLIIDKEIKQINNRHDCSDFSMIMFFRLIHDFKSSKYISIPLMKRIKDMILNYRYWIDEPGNDVMWFFSENHALIFHSCELLAGQLYSNEIFPNANISGKEHYARAEQRLIGWFNRFFNEGLAEWNSAPYIPINVIGLIALYDFAESNEIRDKAAKALDQIFKWLAINSCDGFLTCSQGRVYEKELKGNYNTQTTSLSWIAWGKGVINYSTFGAVPLSLSNYIPSINYKDYIELPKNKFLSYSNQQGPNGYVNLYTYKQNGVMLSSAINFKIGARGYQEHVLQASFGPEANVWINHPGEKVTQGKGRPSYWAGNGYLPKINQYKYLAVAIFSIDDDHAIDFTHAYVPTFAFDDYDLTNNWIFLKKGDKYLAVYASNGLELVRTGLNKNRELISRGRKNIWILRTSSSLEFSNFETFKENLIKTPIYIDNATQKGSYVDSGLGNVTFGWNDPLKINKQIIEVIDETVMGKLIIN